MKKLNIEKVTEQVMKTFHDMIKVTLLNEQIFLENNLDIYEKFRSNSYHICSFIDHKFWKECIEYKKYNDGIIRHSIKEDKKEDAKQYIIKAINEIIEFHNKERSN